MLDSVSSFAAAYGWPIIIACGIAYFLYTRYGQPVVRAAARAAESARSKKIDEEAFLQRQAKMAAARERQLQKLQHESALAAEAKQQQELADAKLCKDGVDGYVPGQPGRNRRSLLKYEEHNNSDATAESSQQKPLPTRRPAGATRLRGEFNPLIGDASAANRYRPAPSAGSAGGG